MSSSSTSENDGLAVIITGGGGFLGQCLASEVVRRGSLTVESESSTSTSTSTAAAQQQRECPVRKIILADIFFAEKLMPALEDKSNCSSNSSSNTNTGNSNIEIVKLVGDVSNASFVQNQLFPLAHGFAHTSVFHLGAVMSGDGERDFDLCMRVNLHGTLHMLEAARQLGTGTGTGTHNNSNTSRSSTRSIPKFLLASAGATIGAGAPTDYVQTCDTIGDASRATPHTTYGMTKAVSELVLSDYSRRNLVHARGLRLPTIGIRAGKPNAATTGCFSGVIREPLAGVDVELPLDSNVEHAVTGVRHAIFGLLHLHNLSQERIAQELGFDRTVFLPAVPVSLGRLQEALLNVVGNEHHQSLGKITYQVDPKLSAVVGSFPTKIHAKRALDLGISAAPTPEDLVREYMEDFPEACQGIVPSNASAATTCTPTQAIEQKVAVITGAGSGIGRAVALRLARDSDCWALVLAGRRRSTLEETAKLIHANNSRSTACQELCIPTDVTDVPQVEHLFATTHQTWGRVDLLFNNAGVNCAAASVPDVPPADFTRVIATNLTGPFLCARAAMKYMQKTTGGGRIINNGSISAQVPRPGSAPYTCSKHAINGLTKCIALDGRDYNVACGQIDFGNVVSELSKATNTSEGALQPNGAKLVEPIMTLEDAAETFMAMANLPISANVLQMTVMATKMPLVGRG